MSAEANHKDMTGVLFENSETWIKAKLDGTVRPALGGECCVNGIRYRVAGWYQTSKKDGREFISLAFSLPQPPRGKPSHE